MSINGTFEIEVTPSAPSASGGAPTSIMSLVKTFSGDLSGCARGTMIAIGEPKPASAASYVALDLFEGTLAGQAGGFVLVHRGTMTKDGQADLQVIIAPDSGTGALEGITGDLTISVKDGQHLYELRYSLPT